jgi:hypothetical protein
MKRSNMNRWIKTLPDPLIRVLVFLAWIPCLLMTPFDNITAQEVTLEFWEMLWADYLPEDVL